VANIVRTTAIFNPELIRQEILKDIRIPPELLNKALKKIESKLEARVTKFFTFQGSVIEKVTVEDHGVQQKAIDQVLEISGIKVKERDQKPTAPQIAFQVLPDGTVQVVVGGAPSLGGDSYVDQEKNSGVSTSQGFENESALPDQLSLTMPEPEDSEPVEQITVVKVKSGRIDETTRKILYGEE
jgi:hypothetical protein